MNSVLKEESFEREVWDPPYDCYAAHSATVRSVLAFLKAIAAAALSSVLRRVDRDSESAT